MRFNIIKKNFINFIKKNNFQLIEDSSIISNDQSLLFINSGMAKIKHMFLEKIETKNPLFSSIQQCLRFQDLNTIGNKFDNHLTLFNMLGLFSINNFIPQQMITLLYKFLFKVIKIPIEHCFFSLHKQDTTTKEFWKSLNISEDKFFYTDKDNIWEYGDNGPLGICSEIFFNLNHKNKDEEKNLLELANIVFITKIKENNKILDNPIKSIDIGIGLERCCMVLQKQNDIFNIDFFLNIKNNIKNKYKITTIKNLKKLINHTHTLNILFNNNIFPSKKKRGYIVKKIIFQIIDILQNNNININDYLENILTNKNLLPNQNIELNIIKNTFNEFNKKIIKQNYNITKYIQNNTINNEISPETAFFLYNTLGFKYKDIIEYTERHKIKLNVELLKKLINKHKTISNKKKVINHDFIDLKSEIIDIPKTIFIGHNKKEYFAKILFKKYYNNNTYLIFDKTPIFFESGGQINDTGFINNKYKIDSSYKQDNKIIYIIKKIILKKIKINHSILLNIDQKKRLNISRNHTATHLLRFLIQEVISKNCMQKGSKVTDTYLSYDFNYNNQIKEEEIEIIENKINSIINKNCLINSYIIEKKDDILIKNNIYYQFEDKYNDKVRVIDINETCKELCEGTHLKFTKDIIFFKIIKLKKISKNIYRIYAITGDEFIKTNKLYFKIINTIKKNTNYEIETLPNKLLELIKQNKKYKKKLLKMNKNGTSIRNRT